MKRLALLALLALVPQASAQSCRQVIRHNAYVAPVKVQQKYVAPVQHHGYDVVYQAFYDPHYTLDKQALLQQGEEANQRLKLLEKQLEILRLELKAAQQAPAAPAPQPRPPADPFNPQAQTQSKHLELFQNKCARCHDATVATAKGQGFVLTQGGQLANLSHQDAAKIASRVYAGTMPPSKGLSDEEVAIVMQWLSEVSKK